MAGKRKNNAKKKVDNQKVPKKQVVQAKTEEDAKTEDTVFVWFMKLFVKQILLLILIGLIPMFWWTFNELESMPKDNLWKNYQSKKFLLSTGLLLMVEGVLYNLLPIDLIPDFLVYGKVDDHIASGIAVVGIFMMFIGYNFGKGICPDSFETVADIIKLIFSIIMPFLSFLQNLLIKCFTSDWNPFKLLVKEIMKLLGIF